MVIPSFLYLYTKTYEINNGIFGRNTDEDEQPDNKPDVIKKILKHVKFKKEIKL